MGKSSWLEEFMGWLAAIPVRFAYRIIWLTAKLGSRGARNVQRAMWDAGLNVPPLPEAGSSVRPFQ